MKYMPYLAIDMIRRRLGHCFLRILFLEQYQEGFMFRLLSSTYYYLIYDYILRTFRPELHALCVTVLMVSK